MPRPRTGDGAARQPDDGGGDELRPGGGQRHGDGQGGAVIDVNLATPGSTVIMINAFWKSPQTWTLLTATSGGHLQMKFTRNNSATDVSDLVQASNDLVTWTTIASLASGTSSWTTRGSTATDNGGAVTVTDAVAAPGSGQRFLQSTVTQPRRRLAARRSKFSVTSRAARAKLYSMARSTTTTLRVGRHTLEVSNLEKVYFPETRFTKGEVLAFYAAVADVILPHLKNRPLTLKRYPDGIAGEPFYEKNAPGHRPPWVKTAAVKRSEGGSINYVLCNDQATLLWATNLGDIEKHVLLARVPRLDEPTAVVFDLDPGDGADIIDCGRVAVALKEAFEALQLQCFVKVSGSKGLHLTVPLNTRCTYGQSQPFSKTVAELIEKQLPKLVVSAMSKSLRRGKVLIDWSQNSESKTTVCVYAMRAKAGGPFVSMPITWEELARAVKLGKPERLFFPPAAALGRLEKTGDLFAPTLTLRQTLPPAFTKALADSPARRLSRWPAAEGRRSGDKSLVGYAAKRDHTVTPEPAATPSKGKKRKRGVHRFVIQKHDASHLHYDWRLEMEGVLRSWAVPKHPPTVPRETRLAMHVEDHPLAYADFEGIIPPRNYGAGTVMVWDHGEYEDQTGDPAAAFAAGKMHITMSGTKLQGEWILVKDKRDDGNRWLLIKAGEPITISQKADDTSAVSGRSMAQIAKAKDAVWHSNRPPTGSRRR